MAYEEILTTSGGTMQGPLKWNSTSLVQFSGAPSYLLGIDAFADGGQQKWQSASSISVGSATTASKLGSSTVGSTTQPIYLNAGAPTKCTYTLSASVPSDAKFTDTVTTVTTSGSGNAVTAITASNGALTVTKNSTFLTTVTKANVTSALGYTPCRAWTVTVPSGSSGSKAITVSGATFGKSPLIAKSSGSDTDYNKITAVSATTNTLTFTLSSATSAALTLMVIETF